MAKLSVDRALTKASALTRKGKFDEARALCHEVLDLYPGNERAKQSLANVMAAVAAKQPTPPKDMVQRLVALYRGGQLELAAKTAENLIRKFPHSFVVWNIAGAAHLGLRNFAKAEAGFERATQLNPTQPDAFNNLGVALREQEKYEAALIAYDNAISMSPKFAEAYNNKGVALLGLERVDEAIAAHQRALELKPDHASAYGNLGNAFQDADRFDDAFDAYQKAIALNPKHAEAYNSMGKVFKLLGRLDEAEAAYERAIELKPDYAEAQWHLSLVHLLKGQLRKGFEGYEWRYKKHRGRKTPPPRPELWWDKKQSLAGKRFLIIEEQGIGDIIQFSRYLPILEEMGAKVTFKVKPALHKLLRTLDCGAEFTTQIPDADEIDFEAPLLSLPHLLDTGLDFVPSSQAYLSADKVLVQKWQKAFNQGSFRVGICWQGSKTVVDRGRSFPLALFKSLAKVPDVQLVSLHKGEGENQIEAAGFDLCTLGPNFDAGGDAFADTAAVMMNCDLIVTSDTAVAHLGGALGRPTWVALQQVPDWRWMLDREDCPWYPTMRLYRQSERGEWAPVFDRIAHDLSRLISQRRA